MSNEGARNRYNASFSSQIFQSTNQAAGGKPVPAGQRRDQTTSELFGSYNDKELHAMPKTFVPREDAISAHQKKMQFLGSEVLPNNASGYGYHPRPQGAPYSDHNMGHGHMDADTEDIIDPNFRRQQELSSELFGRGTPGVNAEKVNSRLMPNDFKWFNIPEPAKGAPDMLTHQDRSFNEKRSNMFNRPSPEASTLRGRDEYKQQQKHEEDATDAKRRHNAYYSDLFGRNTPMDAPAELEENVGTYRPRRQANPEDKICVHQDWTDSRTENMGGGRSPQGVPGTPGGRKCDELHKARIFGGDTGFRPPEIVEPTHHDNSDKTKGAIGMHPQHIHQAHLRTSMTPDEFYEDAYNTKDWEVVELHLSGLPSTYDEQQMRRHCQGHDLQIIKVSVETDPVGNYCKGRAKVMVRYNPKRDSISSLVRKLEDANLRVEM